jgi:hypothetical protein
MKYKILKYLHKVRLIHSKNIDKVDILEVFENKLVEFEIDEDYFDKIIYFYSQTTYSHLPSFHNIQI